MRSRDLLAILTVYILCVVRITAGQEEDDVCAFGTSQSEDGTTEQLQPPANCLSGTFLWSNPSGSVNIAFPHSLLPSVRGRRMKVCLRPSSGAGVTEMLQLWGRRRGRRQGQGQLHSESVNDEETNPWLCTRPSPSRRGVFLVLRADGEEEHQFQELEYNVLEVQHARGSNRRTKGRPKKGRPGSGHGRNRGRRPGPGRKGPGRRRPDREHGGRNTFPLGSEDNPMRSHPRREPERSEAGNERHTRNRGGKHTFPLGHGEYPMRSLGREQENTDAEN